MRQGFFIISLLIGTSLLQPRLFSQIEEVPHPNAPGANQAPPRYDSDREARDKDAKESSSRDTKIDLSPPANDAKDHPSSDAADSSDADSTTQEMRPWDPHKAAKDVEVGDFYFKRKNYRAAIARYQDALIWKDNDADAHFRLGQAYEKVDNPTDAVAHYQQYVVILPHGPDAGEAQKAIQRLKPKTSAKANVSRN